MGVKAKVCSAMKADEDFPRLTPENHRVTSPAMIDYNCIAWAAGDTESWWEPGVFWPIESPPDEYGIGILEAAFKSLGFRKPAMGKNPIRDLRRSPSTATTNSTPRPPGNCRRGSGRASSASLRTSSTIPQMSSRAASTAKSPGSCDGH